MPKLSVELIQKKLMEEDEVKKAVVAKMKTPKSSRPKEVGKVSDPYNRTTSVKQVEVPTGGGKKAKKTSKAKSNTGIPQAEYAYEYIDDMMTVEMSSSKNQKSPKVPKVSTIGKPNQSNEMKEIKQPIRGTEAGNEKSDVFPTSKFASDIVKKMPTGGKNLKASSDKSPTITPPKAENLGGTTRPKGGERKAKDLGKKRDISLKKENNKMKYYPDPKDAPKRKVKWDSMKNGHNVMESVEVRLAGKTKAQFDIVNRNVIKRMVENYSKHGYDLEVVRSNRNASWKSNSNFVKLVRESIDAKYNGVSKKSEQLRKNAIKSFREINEENYNSLYESRDEFVQTIHEAFELIMKNAENKYLDGLEVFECMTRINSGDEIIDLEIVTESVDHGMALRQVRGRVFEEYGLGTKFQHIIVDGKKYKPKDIPEWVSKNV